MDRHITGIIQLVDLHDLTEAMHRFVSAKGWDAQGSPRPQTPRNLAISLNLEASEVLEHFQWREESHDQAELASELADVALYLLQLASITGIDLEQAILHKLERNYQRSWDVPNEERSAELPADSSNPG